MMRVSLDAVSVQIAGAELVRALSLEVGSGEVLGLVGPNGSGKSTALRCVYRALRPTGGAVLLDGADLRSMSLRDSARSVAAVTQENHTELDFTVREVVALGRFPHGRGNSALTGSEMALCAEAMRRTDIAHLAERSVLGLSGGERQRVVIARALVQQPRVLVLDEPTNHLDVRHQVELLSFLRTCGRTVLVALHDLNQAAAPGDRIAVLCKGSLVEIGPPRQVLRPDLIEHVFGVRPSVIEHPETGHPQLLYALHSQPQPEGTRT